MGIAKGVKSLTDAAYGVGIPSAFTKQTSSSRTFFIQKGQLNHYRLRPAIVNEHVETARQIQSAVSAGANVGQIFKASQDNINGITLTLETAQSLVVDDFESYADDTALQAGWVANSARLATLETDIVQEGDQAMALPGSGAVGDEWETTIESADLTGATGSLWIQQTHTYGQQKLRFYIGDGTNTKSAPVVVQDLDAWEEVEISEEQLVEDGGGTTNTAAITKVGLRVEDIRAGSTFYIDDMTAAPAPGSVDLELWDMGDTLPATGVTSLDDGTQYEELGDRGINSGAVQASVRLSLIGGRRQYLVRPFIAGTALEIPSNTILTPGNYYALAIKFVDFDVNVYGANTSFETNYYENGYAFSFPDDATPITALGTYSDIQFGIFSTQDVYVNTFLKFYEDENGEPAAPGGNASESVYIEDKNMHIQGVIANDNKPQQTLLAEFRDRAFEFSKGGKVEVNQNDDFEDDTFQVTVLFGYMHEPPIVNG